MTNCIKPIDIKPSDHLPCNSSKRFDLCPFDQKNSTYLQPPIRDFSAWKICRNVSKFFAEPSLPRRPVPDEMGKYQRHVLYLVQNRKQWFELVPVFGKLELSPFENKIRPYKFELITVPRRCASHKFNKFICSPFQFMSFGKPPKHWKIQNTCPKSQCLSK